MSVILRGQDTSGPVAIDTLRPHPQADLVPWADADSHDALMADIEAHGIQVPLDVTADGIVLDGRTRLAIARVLSIPEVPVRVVDVADPVAYMIRMAVMRRHLGTGQRKALAESLLRQDPARSDRSVAKAVGIAPNTVAAVRDDLVATAQIAQSDTRTGDDGRTRAVPASKPTPITSARTVASAHPGSTPAAEPSPDPADSGAGEGDPVRDAEAFAARERALTPQMREAEAVAAASAEWHRAWSAVLRITGGLDPETVLPRMTADEHVTVRAAIRSMREWLDRAERAMRADGLRAIQGGRS